MRISPFFLGDVKRGTIFSKPLLCVNEVVLAVLKSLFCFKNTSNSGCMFFFCPGGSEGSGQGSGCGWFREKVLEGAGFREGLQRFFGRLPAGMGEKVAVGSEVAVGRKVR